MGCIAHGGLGWIYLATDRKPYKLMGGAWGLINPVMPTLWLHAEAEVRMLTKAQHPNIVARSASLSNTPAPTGFRSATS